MQQELDIIDRGKLLFLIGFFLFFFKTIRNYLDRLAEEVNDKLQESGQVTISELCKTYDLPGNFLTQVFFS